MVFHPKFKLGHLTIKKNIMDRAAFKLKLGDRLIDYTIDEIGSSNFRLNDGTILNLT